MKIAIYGDSFAKPTVKNSTTSWINLLSTKLSDNIKEKITIDNYSASGSSLYFSYKNFIATCKNYDLVIFLATEPHRYTVPSKFRSSLIPIHITSNLQVDQLEKDLFDKLNQNEKDFLKNLRGWFNASDQKYNLEIADILLSNIENKHNNVIIYPCFNASFTDLRFKNYNIDPDIGPLFGFWLRQMELFNINEDEFTDLIFYEKPTISTHLTPEFNDFFAKLLYNKIIYGTYDYTGFFDIKIKMPKNFFYKKWD